VTGSLGVALWLAVLGAGSGDAGRIKDATEALRTGDFEGALALLETAATQTPRGPDLARIHLLRGQCFGALRQTDKARGAFSLALEQDPELELDPQRVDPSLVALLNGVRSQMKGTLQVQADEAGAEVIIDDRPTGFVPLDIPVQIGRHRVSIRSLHTGRTANKEVVVKFKQVELVQLNVAAPPALVATSVTTRPAPNSGLSVETAEAPPPATTSPLRGLAVAGFAVAGVSAIAAGVLSWQVVDINQQLSGAQKNSQGVITGMTQVAAYQLSSRQHSELVASECLWVTAGVLAAAGVVLTLAGGKASIAPAPTGVTVSWQER
jgi:hypothetical protein